MMQNKLFTYFQRSSTDSGLSAKQTQQVKQEMLPENKDLNQKKARTSINEEQTPSQLKGGFTNGMSELKTGLAGVPTGEKPKDAAQIYTEDDSEEDLLRPRRSATQKKRAYVDEDDEDFDEEELKGCMESDDGESSLDASSDSYVKKKKKAPAKKAPPQSAPPHKRQNQSISELKKRPSELTQQPETE